MNGSPERYTSSEPRSTPPTSSAHRTAWSRWSARARVGEKEPASSAGEIREPSSCAASAGEVACTARAVKPSPSASSRRTTPRRRRWPRPQARERVERLGGRSSRHRRARSGGEGPQRSCRHGEGVSALLWALNGHEAASVWLRHYMVMPDLACPAARSGRAEPGRPRRRSRCRTRMALPSPPARRRLSIGSHSDLMASTI